MQQAFRPVAQEIFLIVERASCPFMTLRNWYINNIN